MPAIIQSIRALPCLRKTDAGSDFPQGDFQSGFFTGILGFIVVNITSAYLAAAQRR